MPELIRFYFDEHVPRAVALGLRRRGIDVLTAQQAGRLSIPDDEQLEFAAADGRVMVSEDTDFLILHAAGASHAGIAFAPQGTSVGYLVQSLSLLVQILTPGEMISHLEYL